MDPLRALCPPEFDADPQLWEAVAEAYASPGRHYHTLTHVEEVAGHFAEVPDWQTPIDVFLAVLAHDAIYDVARTDNEARSAELCRAWARDFLGRDGERAAQMVLATATHGADPPVDVDTASFLDCDLAILGASPERFAAYERQIAAEYGALYPEPLYSTGRRAFLQKMLARPRLFHTARFRDRYEAAARANLARALA